MANDSNSPIHWSAAEIARRIARREISSQEVTRAFVARIQAVNPRLNAVVIPRFEQALPKRKLPTSARLAASPLGPLHGVPITLKECFHLAGTPSTIGLDSAEQREIISSDGLLVVAAEARRGDCPGQDQLAAAHDLA